MYVWCYNYTTKSPHCFDKQSVIEHWINESRRNGNPSVFAIYFNVPGRIKDLGNFRTPLPAVFDPPTHWYWIDMESSEHNS